jgi:hypothetical protein
VRVSVSVGGSGEWYCAGDDREHVHECEYQDHGNLNVNVNASTIRPLTRNYCVFRDITRPLSSNFTQAPRYLVRQPREALFAVTAAEIETRDTGYGTTSATTTEYRHRELVHSKEYTCSSIGELGCLAGLLAFFLPLRHPPHPR